jgi:putative ABC transport system ATP-binding protein
VIRILEQLNKDGITLIMVTHDLEMGQRARRQLHMIDGRLHSDVLNGNQIHPDHGTT